MPKPEGDRTKIVRDYLKRFPNLPSLTAAKAIYAKYPSVWPRLEACRSAVRFVRGQQGEFKRKHSTNKSQFKPEGSRAPWRRVPAGIEQIPNWTEGIRLEGEGLTLVIADLHIPWHDDKALDVVLREAKQRKVRRIILLGDVVDGYRISLRYAADLRQRDYVHEIKTLQEFFYGLRSNFGKATEIVWLWGNHCERYDQFMQSKAAELFELDAFQFEEVSHANHYGVVTVKNRQKLRLGDLTLVHGHEPRVSGVYPAANLLQKTGVNTMCGHVHRSHYFSRRNADDEHTGGWTIGGMCHLHPLFCTFNQWNLGGAWVYVTRDSRFQVESFKLIKGKFFRA